MTLRIDHALQHIVDLLEVVPRQTELLVIHHPHVGPGAAAIFGRGSARSGNADRVNPSRLRASHRLQANLVLPQVAEVVLVKKPGVGPKVKIRQTDLAGIGPKRPAARSSNAVLFAADHKTVEMRVGPTENNLQDVMEVGDRVVAADQNPSPDGGL